ncbi:MAG: hypothetical protein ACR2LS_06755 [Thermomicrobiales bacterium]
MQRSGPRHFDDRHRCFALADRDDQSGHYRVARVELADLERPVTRMRADPFGMLRPRMAEPVLAPVPPG